MSNKKRINDRVVKLKKHSAKIEKERKEILVKVILKLGLHAVEMSAAMNRLANSFSNASKKITDDIRSIYESGGEKITSADGSVKKVIDLNQGQKIGGNQWGTFGTSGMGIVKPGSELFMIKKDSIADLLSQTPKPLFDETTNLDLRKLSKVMAVTQNLEKVSSTVFKAQRKS